jgi:hypothetical protein
MSLLTHPLEVIALTLTFISHPDDLLAAYNARRRVSRQQCSCLAATTVLRQDSAAAASLDFRYRLGIPQVTASNRSLLQDIL